MCEIHIKKLLLNLNLLNLLENCRIDVFRVSEHLFLHLNPLPAGGDFCHLLLDPDQALYNVVPGPKVIKPFQYSIQLSMKFILLINVKMPTIVGILTFISMIYTTSEWL